MSTPNTPGGSAPKLILPHGDPVAVELISAIHGGDLDALRRILAKRPALASARMIGRKGLEGGWRTPLHAATDWPGYFPAAPAAVAVLLDAGADPNDDTGGGRPETPLHWAASTDDVDVAVVLIDNGAELETPSATRAGTSRGSWSRAAQGSTSFGTRPRSGCSNGSISSWGSDPTRPPTCRRRSGTLAVGVNDALPSTYSLEGRISTGFPSTRKARRSMRPVLWVPATRTSSLGCESDAPPRRSAGTEITHASVARGGVRRRPAHPKRPDRSRPDCDRESASQSSLSIETSPQPRASGRRRPSLRADTRWKA
jgi:hypothetical protein